MSGKENGLTLCCRPGYIDSCFRIDYKVYYFDLGGECLHAVVVGFLQRQEGSGGYLLWFKTGIY
jgi:hypothetical protein